jgi:hypothetical protein
MPIFKTILTGFLLTISILLKGQDTSGLKSVNYDTLELSLNVPKILAYKTGTIIFLIDYAKTKYLLESQIKYGLHKDLAKQQLDSAEKQVIKNDTAYLDETTFTKSNWDPFNQLLCELLNTNSCIIKDENGTLYRKIIRMHGFVWPDKHIQWSGWRYFIPRSFKYFYECTESES